VPATLQTFLAWLAGLGLTSAAVVAASYALFKWFSEKWLNAKFEERLASYKHAQDRTVKLHQREFEAIPRGVVLTR